jgi:His Kinase A (phospho-acceptor) domain
MPDQATISNTVKATQNLKFLDQKHPIHLYPVKKQSWILLSVICLIFLTFSTSTAIPSNENGLAFIQNFLPEDYDGHGQNWDVIQDLRGVSYIANNTGLLEYDGNSWNLIEHETESYPTSLAIDEDGRIFIGFDNGIGYLHPDSTGNYEIVSITKFVPDSLRDFGTVWQTVATPDGIYFMTYTKLFRWEPNGENDADGKFTAWNFPIKNRAVAFAYIEGRSLLLRLDHLMELKGDSLNIVHGSDEVTGKGIMSLIPLNDRKFLFCGSKGLYTYDGATVTELVSEASEFAKSNNGNYCAAISNNRFLISSFNGGIAVFDSLGQIHEIYDRETGLPDNIVIGSPRIDLYGDIWVPLNYGLSRIEMGSSIRYFDYSLGLDGDIQAIIRYQGTLYAGTAQGLFYLEPATELGRPARWSQVTSIEDRCWGLVICHNRLIVSTGLSCYELTGKDNDTKKLFDFIDLYNAYVSSDSNRIYVNTGSDGIHWLQYENKEFNYKGRVEGTSGNSHVLHDEGNGNIWIVNDSNIEKVTVEHIDGETIVFTNSIIYDSSKGLPSASAVSPIIIHDKLHFACWDGLYQYDQEQDLFVSDSTFMSGFNPGERGIYAPVTDSHGNIWFDMDGFNEACAIPIDAGGYRLAHPLLPAHILNYVAFFIESTENNSVIWAGGDSGQLIRYDDSSGYLEASLYQPLIKSVSLPGDSIVFGGIKPSTWETPTLPYNMDNLRFEYALPQYQANASNRYQYRLVGQSRTWSEWSEETYHDYSYLDEGKYIFEVKGKNIFGSVSGPAKFEFRVPPPFYRTLGAFILYLIAGIFLIRWIVQLQTKRIETRNRQLDNLVKIRTNELLDAINDLNIAREAEIKAKDAEYEADVKAKQLMTANLIAATIAHEFNTPLAVIQGAYEIISMEETNFDNKKRHLQKISKQVITMSELVKKLLKIQELHEIDYASKMKILDIHSGKDKKSKEE